MKTKLTFLLMLATLFSCSNNTQDQEDWSNDVTCGKDFEKFANDFVAICFPKDWNMDDSGVFGSEVMFTSINADVLESGRTFTQNINIMKQDESQLIKMGLNNLDEYAVFSKSQIEEALFQSEILSYEKDELAGMPAYHNIMTANQNGMDLYFDQYMVYKNKHYFIITYTAPIEVSEKDKKMANAVIKTLKINE